MDNPKIRFYVDNNSFWAHGTGVLLALATVFQFVACWGLWNDRFFALTQILLPVASYFLFVLLLALLGKKALWVTILPFLGGVAYYGMQAWYAEDRILMVIGIVYCVLALVLYVGTAFSLIRTKWLLVLLFAVPFCYRAFYRDVLILQNVEQPATFAAGMREISLLCVLLAMTLLALGMKKLTRKGKEPQPVSAPAVEPAPVPAPAPAPAATVENAPSPFSIPEEPVPAQDNANPTENDVK